MRVTKTKSGIDVQLNRRARELQGIPQQAYKKFVQVTPIDSGKARRNTSLLNNTILANYPYADRLNKGWSRQAPKGMWEPTLAYIRTLMRRIFR